MVIKINTASCRFIVGIKVEIKDFFTADTGLPFLLGAI
jgi:hypothetical protein